MGMNEMFYLSPILLINFHPKNTALWTIIEVMIEKKFSLKK